MRNPFTWDDKTLSISISRMDQQHQILIDIMSRLFVQSDTGRTRTEISRTLEELINYTHEHFSQEEVYLESIQYPKLQAHKIIHRDLLRDLGNYANQYNAGTDQKINEEFFTFLKVWLWSHIQGIDRQYSQYALSAGVAA